MAGGYADLLVDPEAFFERRVESPSLLVPALVVLVVGVLSAASFWTTWSTISELTSELAQNAGQGGAEGMGQIMAAVGSIAIGFFFLMAFVGWLFYGVFFFALSALMDGEGDFGPLLAFVGWGFLPKVVEVAIKAVGNWYVMSTISVPDEVTQESFRTFQQSLSTNPVSILLIVVGILSLVWSAYIWVGAVKVSRRLEGREALITVAVPVGLVLVSRLYNLVNAVVL